MAKRKCTFTNEMQEKHPCFRKGRSEKAGKGKKASVSFRRGRKRQVCLQARSQQFAMAGLGAEPTALENFAFFCKNNLILELF